MSARVRRCACRHQTSVKPPLIPSKVLRSNQPNVCLSMNTLHVSAVVMEMVINAARSLWPGLFFLSPVFQQLSVWPWNFFLRFTHTRQLLCAAIQHKRAASWMTHFFSHFWKLSVIHFAGICSGILILNGFDAGENQFKGSKHRFKFKLDGILSSPNQSRQSSVLPVSYQRDPIRLRQNNFHPRMFWSVHIELIVWSQRRRASISRSLLEG